MTLEAESKFPVDDFSEITSTLRHNGTLVTPWHFEHNQVFDLPQGDLRSRGYLLRLRNALDTTLTLKRPPAHHARIPGVKQLEELECTIHDSTTMTSILHALGYREILQYEKFRSQWRVNECTVCLDLLCFGTFVEIEGTGSDILATATRVGLDPQTATSANYHDLFHEHLAKRNLPLTNSFVFSRQERTALCRKLGIDTP
ncbi:class IV adenylate cyclase [Desulfoplanes formicivorans]|uniref:Adenylate cyclase n=1 Tax=Desulfoplanes formicivorans TaxID=1592317 RepID=A0A194AHX6_9BACT|nr:class IV adenylate cyclase [Desulfoplanes formicivorans]GAU09682.1 adenylate cyclase [Desulfoplanes formicivorans]